VLPIPRRKPKEKVETTERPNLAVAFRVTFRRQ